MRRPVVDFVCASCKHCSPVRTTISQHSRRQIQISATPSSIEPQQSLDAASNASSGATPDARFEVLGSPFSLLSASVSASQPLYTRKGTLVGFSGQAENAVSSLSLLSPLRRALLGIPFVYQKVTSTTPFTALIGTKTAITSLVVVHLDGRLDWMVAQRNALLAWTGHTLALSPALNAKMSLAHWGSTTVTGRGLLALSGNGLIHQVSLKTNEEYVVHPGNVIAYSAGQQPPQPYRFRANALRFQIPSPRTWLPDTRFFQTLRETFVWRTVRDVSFAVRTWTRRYIWGDRLFLHFRGPATILLQSRGSSLRDVLTARDVNEIADSPAGSVAKALSVKPASEAQSVEGQSSTSSTRTSVSYASVGTDGKVKFDEAKP